MSAADQMRATSRVLNKVLFGSRVASDEDAWSQVGTIGTAYLLNVLMIFVVVAAIGTVAGYYQPLDAPFANPTLRVMLALSNVVTFALTYVASLTWEMHEKAIEVQRAARGPVEIVVLIVLFSIPSLFFLAALFLILDFGGLIASAVINAFLLQMFTSERIFKSTDRE